MCGLKEIFEGAGNFSDKKVPANSTSRFGKLNLIRFIKTLYKNLFPSSVSPTAQHLLHRGEGFKTLPSNLRFATFPFRDGKKLCKWISEKRNLLRFDKSFAPTFSKVGQGLG